VWPLGPGSARAGGRGAPFAYRGARWAGTREGAAKQSLVSRASGASALARAERDPISGLPEIGFRCAQRQVNLTLRGPSGRSANRGIV
jgi:hypothetical protein